jgi:hypothetical protein
MRVAIDARKLHDYGIGTYVRNLLTELARQDDDAEYLLLCAPSDVEVVRASGRGSGRVLSRGQLQRARAMGRAVGAGAVARGSVSRPHYVVPPLTPVPFVVQVHDCIHCGFRSICRAAPRVVLTRARYVGGRTAIAPGADRVASLKRTTS